MLFVVFQLISECCDMILNDPLVKPEVYMDIKNYHVFG